MNRWKSKVNALIRLADDQAGKPEGELAREKLRQILEKYPEARQYQPVRAFMLKDVLQMKKRGISLEGSWTGGSLQEAIALMMADYRARILKHDRKDLESLVGLVEDYDFLTGASVGMPLGIIEITE